MRIGEIINSYIVIGVDGNDFSTKGSGLSMWTFARKDGVDYFMKEFLYPTYPLSTSPGSHSNKTRKLNNCIEFEKHHIGLKDTISLSVSIGGNLVKTIDFFRHNTKYYKITEKIDVSSISIEEISKLPIAKRLLIMKTVSHSLEILHKLNIVHGDLKPGNILIKKTEKDFYTSKLIDFDNSYFVGNPLMIHEEMVGDPAYYSPELENYILGRSNGEDLNQSSDIFALGLIFCQYLTGKGPVGIDKNQYASNVVNNGGIITIDNSEGLVPKLVTLINSMLLLNTFDRPSIKYVFDSLKTIASSYKVSMDDIKEPIVDKSSEKYVIKKGNLSINLGNKKKK